LIKVNKQGELIDNDKSKDALTAEQLQQTLLDFNPVENKEDVQLANYLAGRELSSDELSELFEDAKRDRESEIEAAMNLYAKLRLNNRTYSTALKSPSKVEQSNNKELLLNASPLFKGFGPSVQDESAYDRA
jgi:hypothetical protein